jgi:hypothetical protein
MAKYKAAATAKAAMIGNSRITNASQTCQYALRVAKTDTPTQVTSTDTLN